MYHSLKNILLRKKIIRMFRIKTNISTKNRSHVVLSNQLNPQSLKYFEKVVSLDVSSFLANLEFTTTYFSFLFQNILEYKK